MLLVPMVVASASVLQGTCPWTQRPGYCVYPVQQVYKTISVAGSAHPGGACCFACSQEEECVEWLVYTKERNKKYPAGTCFLHNATTKGSAANVTALGCVSGVEPAPTFPPTPAPAPAPSGALNVLFLAVDDLRPEITAFGGIPGTVQPPMHTPNIDALAKKSLVLQKNYVQQAVCSPTRASLLTGRRPDRTRTYDLYSYFRTVGGNFTTIVTRIFSHSCTVTFLTRARHCLGSA
jgi:hypothetical protein